MAVRNLEWWATACMCHAGLFSGACLLQRTRVSSRLRTAQIVRSSLHQGGMNPRSRSSVRGEDCPSSLTWFKGTKEVSRERERLRPRPSWRGCRQYSTQTYHPKFEFEVQFIEQRNAPAVICAVRPTQSAQIQVINVTSSSQSSSSSSSSMFQPISLSQREVTVFLNSCISTCNYTWLEI